MALTTRNKTKLQVAAPIASAQRFAACEAVSRERQPLLVVAGLSHHTAPIDLRERFSIPEEHYQTFLERALACPFVSEAFILSTCNRVEVALVADVGDTNGGPIPIDDIRHGVLRLFTEWSKTDATSVGPLFYAHYGSAAVSHVFRVAAGLDSLVLGEPQILGQLKAAYNVARNSGGARVYLNRLLQHSFHVAKLVRSQTGIGKHAVSVCSAAKDLLKKKYQARSTGSSNSGNSDPRAGLASARVLIVGAGEMGGLMARHLKSEGVTDLVLASRTAAHAVELATELGTHSLDLEIALKNIGEYDVIVAALAVRAGESAVILPEQFSQKSPDRSITVIDLGVPRNVRSDVGSVVGVELVVIDDLREVVQENVSRRRLEQRRGEVLVEQHVEQFQHWLEQRQLGQPLRDLMSRVHRQERDAVEQTLSNLSSGPLRGCGAETIELVREALEKMARSLSCRVLHDPLDSYRRLQTANPQTEAIFRELFQLDAARFDESENP